MEPVLQEREDVRGTVYLMHLSTPYVLISSDRKYTLCTTSMAISTGTI